MAITNAYVQSQWEQIKRDIRNGVKEGIKRNSQAICKRSYA